MKSIITIGLLIFLVAEEETESCISGPPPSSGGRHVRIDLGDQEIPDRTKTVKKKPGLFRGLGSMFRFGRHRKSNPAATVSDNRRQHNEIEWDSQDKSHYSSNIDQVNNYYCYH